VSPIQHDALEVAHSVLGRQRGLQRLSNRDRREVEALVAAVALRVADALERLDSYDAATSGREVREGS
jgi:hypothetical protein